MDTVSFTRMADGSAEDYMLLAELEKQHAAGVAGRVLEQLRGLARSFGGYQVDRLEHSLQVASRAHRDGASEELVVVALLHDIGDMLAPLNHGCHIVEFQGDSFQFRESLRRRDKATP